MICNAAETLPGLTSILLERNEVSLTFKNVPVRICPNCGEAYANEVVTVNLLRSAEKQVMDGTKVDMLEYTETGN